MKRKGAPEPTVRQREGSRPVMSQRALTLEGGPKFDGYRVARLPTLDELDRGEADEE